jgi:nitrite reductase/ring-hydroxylating ferredoxin subunit
MITDRSGEAMIEELVKDGELLGRTYTDPEVFELEMEKIFYRTWIFVAHESEVSEPGDYKTTYIGRQPVIVSRAADDGKVRVLLNRCRHRGATVCQQEYGNSNYFRCPYHGWTYSNTGRLNGVPFPDGYEKGFDKSELGLVSPPRVGEYRGFIFASLSEDVPDLEEHLGLAREQLDYVADQDIKLSAGVQKYAYRANWKFQVENTIDPYHLGFVHQSFFEIVEQRTGKKTSFSKIHKKEKVSDLGRGHCVYELEGDLGIGALPFNLIVFPTLSFVGSHLRLVRPVAVDYTEVFLYPLMLGKVSPEENARWLRVHEGFYGPASFGTPDDMAIAFERVRKGLEADRLNDSLIVRRGKNREVVDDRGVPSSTGSDEVSIRALYKEWKRLMSA